MATFKACVEITPVQARNPLCPFNCIDCEYFGGLYFNNDKSAEISCELDDN